MLVLTRKAGERILIGDDVVITVLEVRGGDIRIGVEAPKGLRIQRQEVIDALAAANLEAASAPQDDAATLAGLLAQRAPADPE